MHYGGSKVNSPREPVAASQEKIRPGYGVKLHPDVHPEVLPVEEATFQLENYKNALRVLQDVLFIPAMEGIQDRLLYESIPIKTDPFTYGGLGSIYRPSIKGKVPEETMIGQVLASVENENDSERRKLSVTPTALGTAQNCIQFHGTVDNVM